MFSHLSVNNDEAAYLLQAKALASGHLFPPVGHPADSFTPWLGVVHGDHYVMKYTPVVASFLALSLLLTGGYAAALAGWAAAFVAVTYLLAKETTKDRRTAATAAILAAAAPLTIIQSALALPYLPFLVLIEIALWALLVGARRGSVPILMVSGVCTGLGFAARSFDAILILLPTLAWLLWTTPGRRFRVITGGAAGGLLPGLGLLCFDYAATGSAFKLPFSLFSSQDTLGFGDHRLYPGEPARHFGLTQGWEGLSRHLSLLGGGWALGGFFLLVVGALAFARRLVPPACMTVLAGGLLLSTGYLFFWGTWNAAIVWGAVQYLGPYYLLPLLVPLSIVGAIGLRSLAASSKLGAILLSLAGCALSAVMLIPAVLDNLALTAANAELANAISAKGRSLVFVNTYPGYLAHPTAVISNDSPVGGKTVFALQKGGDDFTVMRSFPGRPIYQLRLLGEYGKHSHSGYGATLQRLSTIAGTTVTVSVRARVPESIASARLVVRVGTATQVLNLPIGQDADVPLAFSTESVIKTPGLGLAFTHLQPETPEAASVTLVTRTLESTKEAASTSLVLPLMRSGSRALALLAPSGYVTKLGPSSPPALTVIDAKPGRA